MTLTETSPEAPAPAHPGMPAAPTGLLSTADHKRLGLLYLAVSLLFLVVGGVLGVALRGELAEAGNQFLGDDFVRVFSMHATVTPVLFLAPLWIGLATFLVPLQIGASRLALPRLHAFAFWLHVIGGGILVASYIIGRPTGLGLSTASPIRTPEGGGEVEAVLWAIGLLLVAVATFLASLDLAVTLATLRTPGLTYARLPLFSLATGVANFVALLAVPVFVAGMLLLYLDQQFGGQFFGADNPAAQVVWQHTAWLFGRPEVYLLLLPGLGAACDIVATHARKPLLSHAAAVGLVSAFGLLSLAAWGAGTKVADAVVLPTYSPATALVAVPVGLLALLWLGSLAKGAPRFHVSLAFVAGFLGLAAFGAVNAIVAAVAEVDGGTAWTTAHVHVVVFGAPLLLGVASLYHWAPKLFGRQLANGLGGIVFLLLFGGFFLNGLGTYLLGYDGAPAHVGDYTDTTQLNYSRLAAAGGVLVLVGVALLVLDVARALAGRGTATSEADPYEGLTLEWATASPPAPENFDAVPEVRSPYPLYDLRTSGGSTR
jgi:cytochrome c oxidase subunit 1